MLVEQIKKAIQTAGFRATKSRVAFLEMLEKSRKPLSIADISDALGTKADLVTVYRIAESFEKAGLVSRVEMRAGKVHYEFAHGKHHHHIVCTDCGTVEDVDVCLPGSVTRIMSKKSKSFSTITSHALEFFGTCKNCTYA